MRNRLAAKERQTKFLALPEIGKITCITDVVEDYNPQGDLGLILKFSGIKFPDAPVFERGKHDYGKDSCVFYSQIGYKDGLAYLIVATLGDIFESQVVITKKDEKPIFREEILLSQLGGTYDLTSMTVKENNNLVVVSYRLRNMNPAPARA